MDLQTKIPLSEIPGSQIDYRSEILLLGSCFSKNIAEKFEYFKFRNFVNPFGILFHPAALERLISKSVEKEYYAADQLFLFNERWHCFDAHSDLSSKSEGELLEKLNGALDRTHQAIGKASHIIITLGTAWSYRHIGSDKLVANCHKVPQKEFSKELLSVGQIGQALIFMIESVNKLNAHATILFTVSPVRHLRDGFVENMRSKSHLIAAVHQLVDPNKNVHYFPAYELLMDELRDYRFYKEDMIHPNKLAVDYIWKRFMQLWISPEAELTMQRVNDVQKRLLHRPFDPNSEQYKSFLNELQEKQSLLKQDFPHIIF